MSLSVVPSRSSAWPTKSHGPAAMKPVATVASRIVRPQHVARELLLHEARVRLVLVERADHVIAIGPGIAPRLVLVVAVRFAVVHHIQPVASPALAVARRGEQAVHQLLVGVGRAVGDEGLNLFPRGRQAVQIVGEPADQGGRIRLRRTESASFPRAWPPRRHRWGCAPSAIPTAEPEVSSAAGATTARPFRCPRAGHPATARPVRSRSRISATCAGESGVPCIGIFGFFAGDHPHQQALVRLARHDGGPVQPALSCIGGGGQRKAAHPDRRVVTLEAALRQDGGGLGRFGRARDRSHGEDGEKHLSGRGQHHRN